MLTFKELSGKYLDWCFNHQAERTYAWYKNYIDMACAYAGIGDTPAYDLKPYHVQEWIDSHGKDWGSTYRGGAVVTIKRIFNWAESMGYGEGNPIKKMKKATAQRRNTYMKPEDYDLILEHIPPTDPFRDVLVFAWNTGARPQEIRHIEHRHVAIDRGFIVFPKEESKGKRRSRRIILNATATEILQRWMGKNADGKVFRNTRNEAWTKYALCSRMAKLSELTKLKLCMYDARHGFAQRKLKAKFGHIEIAEVMGHVNGNMLATVYQHLGEDTEHLRSILD